MLAFSVTNQTALCVSLRSNKCVEYIYFLIKHFEYIFETCSALLQVNIDP